MSYETEQHKEENGPADKIVGGISGIIVGAVLFAFYLNSVQVQSYGDPEGSTGLLTLGAIAMLAGIIAFLLGLYRVIVNINKAALANGA